MFRRGEKKDPQLVRICNIATKWEADQVKDLLENAGIPALVMDREDSGEYLRVLGVGSPFGVDVYVSSPNADRAKQLVDEVFSEKKDISEEELAELAMSMPLKE